CRHTPLRLGRAQDGWPDGAERDVDPTALLVDDQAEAGDCDHHGVAGADLGKAARAPEPSPAGADDELIRSDCGLLRAGEKEVPGQRPFTPRPAPEDHL